MPPDQRQQILKGRVEEFGTQLYTEWEPKLLDEIAASANTTEGITGEDLQRLGPFINQLMVRIFGVGVTAAIKAYPRFKAMVGARPTPAELAAALEVSELKL
jgi:hypothetical protein